MSSLSDKTIAPKTARSGSKRKRKESKKIDKRLYFLIPIALLSVLAVLASNMRVQRERTTLIMSAATATARTQMQVAMDATEEANQARLEATEEARVLAAAVIPTEVPTAIPTATSEPTQEPVAEPTEAPTALPEPTATATPLPEPTATLVPTLVPTPEPFSAEISTSFNLLTIRRGPDTGYSRLGAAEAGEPFTAIGQNEAGDWIQICCVNGENGWMATEFVTADVALDELPIVSAPEATVNNSAESIPLYAGPFYNFDLITRIPFDSTLVVTGRNPNGEWYQVCCTVDGESGWVYSGSVLVDGDVGAILEVTEEE